MRRTKEDLSREHVFHVACGSPTSTPLAFFLALLLDEAPTSLGTRGRSLTTQYYNRKNTQARVWERDKTTAVAAATVTRSVEEDEEGRRGAGAGAGAGGGGGRGQREGEAA